MKINIFIIALLFCYSEAIIKKIGLGVHPNDIIITSTRAYVSDFGVTGSSRGGSIAVLDTTEHSVIGWIKNEEYINHPLSIQLSKSQENLFVANSNGHFISNISIESGAASSMRVEIDGLRKILISDDGKLLYAASSGEVTVLYSATLEIVATIPLEDSFPVDMALGEINGASVLYVAHQRGKVSMHDASSGKVLSHFQVDSQELVFSMQFDKQSKLYITTGTSLHNIGNLYVVHSKNLSLDYKLSSVSSSPSFVTLSANGKNGYLVDSLQSEVLVWDLATDKITKRIPVDCAALGRVALPETDNWFYVPCSEGAVYMYKDE